MYTDTTATKTPRNSGWNTFFTVISITQFVSIAITYLLYLWGGTSGGLRNEDILSVIVFALVILPLACFCALTCLIGIPIHLIRHRTKGAALIFFILSFIVAVGILAIVGFFVLMIVYSQAIHS